jgi:hypothetical protein
LLRLEQRRQLLAVQRLPPLYVDRGRLVIDRHVLDGHGIRSGSALPVSSRYASWTLVIDSLGAVILRELDEFDELFGRRRARPPHADR